ncbi:tyrosine-type recombinase/integrase [Streptomyces scopuliridis]|uniref:Integrase n=1 Tax=Streptomyces scopuliridis RB72 TaxID=1440053 RepID=A0A2T7T6F7_9ACTN|nr:site-specific integrase [Streptomyces scopuliridis]PVE10704.1 integrase [Streptomyces scopuliridis RB72]
MAGHIQDRWFKTETDANGKTRRVKTARYGTGMRYRARYIGPDGTEKSKSFRDGQKRLAEKWLSKTEADMDSGQYVDPKAGRTTFQQYAERWVASHSGEVNSGEGAERRLRLHAYPGIGSRPLGSFKAEHVRTWLGGLKRSVPNETHRRVIAATVSAVFNAAVDDELMARNPFKARSVQVPKPGESVIEPWTAAQVFGVQRALPERFRAAIDLGAGCGLRQGEVFGLSVDEVDFESGWLSVNHQLKRLRGRYVFAPPKGGKTRKVPLPASVADALRAHADAFPSLTVTLPWRTLDGEPRTKRLYFSGNGGLHVRVSYFNDSMWKPALAAAGRIPEPEEGERYASAREHGMHALRHFYASVLLDAGENIKALSRYLGHADAGFTLRTYTHLMPSSEQRTRKAVDGLYEGRVNQDHGPQTAHED